MTATEPMTAEQLLELEDDGFLYELVRGELVRMTPPGGEHGEVAGEAYWHLRNYIARNPIGRVYAAETGFLLARDPDLVRAPDAAFVRGERLPPREARKGYLPLAPDLAVEVVSPTDRAKDVHAKVMDFLDAGTRLVWVIEPERRTVTVYRSDRTSRVLREDEELDGEDVLPGLRLLVADIFR
jgi:Uma2 family endonuclease